MLWCYTIFRDLLLFEMICGSGLIMKYSKVKSTLYDPIWDELWNSTEDKLWNSTDVNYGPTIMDIWDLIQNNMWNITFEGLRRDVNIELRHEIKDPYYD